MYNDKLYFMVAFSHHRMLFHFQVRDLIKKCRKIIIICNIFQRYHDLGSVAAVTVGTYFFCANDGINANNGVEREESENVEQKCELFH